MGVSCPVTPLEKCREFLAHVREWAFRQNCGQSKTSADSEMLPQDVALSGRKRRKMFKLSPNPKKKH
jgi:hypothetical protein